MGAFRKADEITVSGKPGWEPGEYIKIKGVMTVGDQRKIAALQAGGTVDVDLVAMLDCMVIEWNLFGDHGPEPLNRYNIERLPTYYSDPVAEEVMKVVNKGKLADPLASMNGVKTPSLAM